jgi:hypothetical protein
MVCMDRLRTHGVWEPARWLLLVIGWLTLTMTGSASAAETFWGLTTDQTLVKFSSTAPGTALATLPITGLPDGERLLGIEVLDDDGSLVGISSTARVYNIDRQTGAAAARYPGQDVRTTPGTAFGFAGIGAGTFMLLVSDTGVMTHITSTNGAQTPLGVLPAPNEVTAFAGRITPTTADFFAVNSTTDSLYLIQNLFTTTSMVPVGPLTVDASAAAGLDIARDGVLYAALTVAGTPGLYTLNAATGAATLAGATTSSIVSLTIEQQGTLQITKISPADTLPRVTNSVAEGDTTVVFRLRRQGETTMPVDFTVQTTILGGVSFVPHEATPNEDYVPKSEAVHFDANEIEKNFSITLTDDTAREFDEHLFIAATENVPGAQSGYGIVTIIDSENQAPVLTVTSPVLPLTTTAESVVLTGTVADEEAGVNILAYSDTPGGYPFFGTANNPWTITAYLKPGVNRVRLEPTDALGRQGATVEVVIYRMGQVQQTFVFAEGATGSFFSTDLLFANPSTVDVPVVIDFLKEDGTIVPHTVVLPAQRRTTLAVDTIPGLESTATAAIVQTDQAPPIVVERTMRWNESGYGASTEKAASALSRTWYFAEGSQGFFSTFLLLVNPQASSNEVTVRFLRESAAPVTRTYTMSPRQRLTIDAGSVPELVDRSFGIEVTFVEPGLAERSMYFGTHALWDAGHESAGVPAPATDWYLAEGATGPFFETFVLVANPTNDVADVTFTFLPEAGASVTRAHQVPAGGRLTVNIETEDPALANLGAIGTRVTSTVPVVVERSQYWPYTPDQWYEAHNSFGQTETARHWGLAEGRVGGDAAYKTYILLTNPDPGAAAQVTLTFLREGDTPVVKAFTIAPASRLTVDVGGAQVPEITNGAFGTEIVSTASISVERAMYANANGQFWAAGTNAAATRLP